MLRLTGVSVFDVCCQVNLLSGFSFKLGACRRGFGGDFNGFRCEFSQFSAFSIDPTAFPGKT